jgi:hypothetical protein
MAARSTDRLPKKSHPSHLFLRIPVDRHKRRRYPANNSKESAMLNHTNKVRLIIGASVLLAAVTFLGTAASQKASAPKAQDRLTLGEEHVKQLLLLMDTDKNGMVSKQEYMHFMEAEFQRLDKSHEGQLNARQLNQSTVSASHFTGK